jgi:hypothetical protein
MLSVPSLSDMLTVIGVALFATIVLVALLGVLIGRTRTTPTAGFRAQVPAQRQSHRSNSNRSKTPVSSH